MGIIRAVAGAVSGVLSDQWKDFFYCDAMSENVIGRRVRRRVSKGSGNTKSDDEIITEGSIIAVADGQCALVVEGGKVIGVFKDPGEHIVDSKSSPSVFAGSGGSVLKEIGRRISFGGDVPGRSQRVYYIDVKECLGNRFSTDAGGVPARVCDPDTGLDMEVSVAAEGLYSFRVTDPAVFYKRVCGNFESICFRDDVMSQLESEALTGFQQALSNISDAGLRSYMISGETVTLGNAMMQYINSHWAAERGISITTIAFSSLRVMEKDGRMIRELQFNAVFRPSEGSGPPDTGAAGMAPSQWICGCGQVNYGKFCSNCGREKLL